MVRSKKTPKRLSNVYETGSKNFVIRPKLWLRAMKQQVSTDNLMAEAMQYLMDASKPDRQLFLMRHGERVDFTFGTNWIVHNFDKSNHYSPKNLNMPDTLPARSDGPIGYLLDSPITKIGLFQAQLVGEAFKKANLELSHVYSSPAYRCIQTCDAFLRGYQKRDELKIKIEPGLFEFLGVYLAEPVLPQWMSPEENVAAGYNIDLDYVPCYTTEMLFSSEEGDPGPFYARSATVTKSALDAHKSGNILFVGHSATLDVCSRELIGKKPRDFEDMVRVIQKTPFCGFLELAQKGKHWRITGQPLPSITHEANRNFDYSIMLD